LKSIIIYGVHQKLISFGPSVYGSIPLGWGYRLNIERGITVLLITHEHDIAEYGSRIIACRDGQIVSDNRVVTRRSADEELRALPQEAVV